MTKKSICDTLRRTCLILAGSFIMAVNLKSFVRAGGLIPGGFNGLTRLIQEISVLLWHWEPPFSVINFILNAVPVVISFKFIGKKFTGYSCLMIVVSGILTDMVPAWPVTEDILLIAIFGGLINALAISLCLFANATSGGTDFIEVLLSDKYGIIFLQEMWGSLELPEHCLAGTRRCIPLFFSIPPHRYFMCCTSATRSRH